MYVCMHVVSGGWGGGTSIYLEKKASGGGAREQGEGPTVSLEQWLRCQLHNLTWDHWSLLVSYEGLSGT